MFDKIKKITKNLLRPLTTPHVGDLWYLDDKNIQTPQTVVRITSHDYGRIQFEYIQIQGVKHTPNSQISTDEETFRRNYRPFKLIDPSRKKWG